MKNWKIEAHPTLCKDLNKLGKRELLNYLKKVKKIKKNPLRFKHLSGGTNCYREPITDNIRLVYYVEGNIIFLLTVGAHDKALKLYIKRLHSLKKKLEEHDY